MAGDCVFCAIVAGEVEADVVFSDDATLAFLDTRPLFPGHTLLVPRDHHEAIWDLPDPLASSLWENARKLTVAVRDAMGSQGAFVANNNIVSQSVPHFHIHIVPRNRKDGLRGFFWPRRKYGEGEAEKAAEAIRSALASA
jgi:histidine triad (HIT) family protein